MLASFDVLHQFSIRELLIVDGGVLTDAADQIITQRARYDVLTTRLRTTSMATNFFFV